VARIYGTPPPMVATLNAGLAGGRNDFGELVPESNPPWPMVHRQCRSGAMIFSASNSGRTGGNGGDHASSLMLNALPVENICPSGRIPGPVFAPLPPCFRSNVL
jgi:hypothetical protein